jgi:hypothetical protein
MVGNGRKRILTRAGVSSGNGTGLAGYRKTIMKFLFLPQGTLIQPTKAEITSQVKGLDALDLMKLEVARSSDTFFLSTRLHDVAFHARVMLIFPTVRT